MTIGTKNRGIASASNSALTEASGSHTALVDHDDLLSRDAFLAVYEAWKHAPATQLFYTDECIADLKGRFQLIWPKPAWSPAYLENTMYIGHLSIYKTDFLRSLGGFRSEYDKWSAHKRPGYHSTSSYGDCVTRFSDQNPSGCSFSLPFYGDLRDHAASLSSIAAFGGSPQLNVSGNGEASVARGILVSGNYFSTLGVPAALGRPLQSGDNGPAAPPVAVLNYAYWLHDFAGSPAVVGKTVELNGVPTIVVGVAARSFTSLTPGNIYDIFIPISMRSRITSRWNATENDAGSAWLAMVGRLKPGVPTARAQAEVDTMLHRALSAGTKPLIKPGDGLSATLTSAQSGLAGARGRFTQPLTIMMLAVGVILLIACANIGGLQLARAILREKEMALRVALGGGQGRIMRQLLTESLVVATMGGIVGLAFSWIGARVILAMVAGSSTRPTGLTGDVDIRVLLFTAGISLLSGILFGLAPASRGMRMDLNRSLRDGSGNAASRGRARFFSLGQVLAVAQIALCVVTLTGAGLLVRTLQNLRSVDPGFDTNNILLFSINPTLIGYKPAAVDALNRALQGRLASLPGVTGVSFAQTALLSGSLSSTTFELPNRPGVAADSNWLPVGIGYLTPCGHPFSLAAISPPPTILPPRLPYRLLLAARRPPTRLPRR